MCIYILKQKKQKALEPLIATILLVVVAVIITTLVLTWGKLFTTKELDIAKKFGELTQSDVTHFIFLNSTTNGIIQFNYLPPNNLKDKQIKITHYTVLEIPELNEPIELKDSKFLSFGVNLIDLTGLYAYATLTSDFTVQLITTDNTFIKINVTDSGMVCNSEGDGSKDNPFIICTVDDLNNIVRNNLDANFLLGKDIDLYFSKQDANGWKPIGDEDNYFNSNFDGKNYTISNLYINRPNENNIGLFSGVGKYWEVTDAVVANLKLKDVNIMGWVKVGGIVGNNAGATIIDCFLSGSIFGENSVGGLVGDNLGKIINCSSSGSVIGKDNVGCLVGVQLLNYLDGSGGVFNSLSYADYNCTGLNCTLGCPIGVEYEAV